MDVPNGVSKVVRWGQDHPEGIFVAPYNADKQRSETLTDLYDLVRERIFFDFHINIEFAPDITGERRTSTTMGYYYPSAQDKFDLFLDSFTETFEA